MICILRSLISRITPRLARAAFIVAEDKGDDIKGLYSISEDQHDEILNWSLEIIKDSINWKSRAKNEAELNEVENEQIYIEILELLNTLKKIVGSKEQLLTNSERGLNRVLRSLEVLHNSTAQILRRRDVVELILPDVGEIPDDVECRIVEIQENSSVPSGTVLSIVKGGYRLGTKILVPTEVITAQ